MKKLIRTAVIVGAVISGNVYAAGDETFDSIVVGDISTTGITIGPTSPSINDVAISSTPKSTNVSVADRSLTTQGYVDKEVGGVKADLVTAKAEATTAITNVNTRVTAVDARVDGLQTQVNALGSRINEVERNANAGIAGVAAMSQIQVAPGKDFAVGAGVGTYRGQSALAIGAAARLNENLHLRAGFSSSGVVAAGVTYSW